jgi:lipid A ethanolaminephosphotransferase
MSTLSKLFLRIGSPQLHVTSVIILLSVYFAVVLNYPINQRIYELSTEGHLLFKLSPAVLLTGLFLIIFSMLSISIKYVFKPFVTLLLVSSATTMFAMLFYNVMFDYGMIENIFETNTGEAWSYVSLPSVLFVTTLGIVPSLLLLRNRVIRADSILKGVLQRIGLVVVGLALVGVVALFFYKDYASVGRNNHYLNKMINPAHIFNTVKYINNTYLTEPLVYKARGTDAHLAAKKNPKPTLFVLVVGETARADNMAYYGYSRNTNPFTQSLDMISVANVSSCGTATAHSLPCMMSDMNRDNFKRNQANAQDNVLEVLQQAGIEVTWFESDGGDKEVASHIIKNEVATSDSNPLCDDLTCFDAVLVEQLSAHIKARAVNDLGSTLQNQFIALHTIGSHGPTYWERYPKEMEVFTPACNRSDIENCTDEEIVNVYDNTIHYTDYILSQVVSVLKQYESEYQVAMLYVSDHGESLGENGLYLHGTPYAIAPSQQTHVPWLMWLPESYTEAKMLDRKCIVEQASKGEHSHANLFHTLLGLYGVETHLRNSQLDISQNCRVD